jgi:hypothetical protein
LKGIWKDKKDGNMRKNCKQLLDEVKVKREYWILKEETLDCSLWRTRFGRGYEPVIRRTTDRPCKI